MNIVVFDPGIKNNNGDISDNLGDIIIQEAVRREVGDLFKHCNIYSISVHTMPSKQHIDRINMSDYVFVGGSNLIGNSKFYPFRLKLWRQWKMSLRTARHMKSKAVLLGVGWRDYESGVGWYTRELLNEVLDKHVIHSVRDEYTKNKLKSIGITNVINTGCPTTWPLSNTSVTDYFEQASKSVLLMLTDYRKCFDFDRQLVKLISRKYENVYFWPQGKNDYEYANKLGFNFICLDRSLIALDQLLIRNPDLDYIGTRLHGGIRCLLAKKRALILAVDNRAKEMEKNIGLPVIQRNDFEQIENWIEGRKQNNGFRINTTNIDVWKKQFI